MQYETKIKLAEKVADATWQALRDVIASFSEEYEKDGQEYFITLGLMMGSGRICGVLMGAVNPDVREIMNEFLQAEIHNGLEKSKDIDKASNAAKKILAKMMKKNDSA